MIGRNSLQIGDKPLLDIADSAIRNVPNMGADGGVVGATTPGLTIPVLEAPMIANQRAVARPDSICNARAELDAARQAHMRAVQMALAAGMPAAEIEHDTQ